MKDKLTNYIIKQVELNRHFIIEAIVNNVSELIKDNLLNSEAIVKLIDSGIDK